MTDSRAGRPPARTRRGPEDARPCRRPHWQPPDPTAPPKAGGTVAAVAFREGRREQGEGRGGHHRGADALPGAGRQDLPLGLGEAGGRRGEGEGAETDEEQAATSEQVADPAEDDE